MNRALIVGCPGSGKSTFARRLRDVTGLPLHYLDMLYWNADKTHVSGETFDARLEAILIQERWIIDGNYARTLPRRLERCDAVFFLDYPTSVCIEGIAARRGSPREDMPWVETTEDAAFMDFVRTFRDSVRPTILRALERATWAEIHWFRRREDADKCLEG